MDNQRSYFDDIGEPLWAKKTFIPSPDDEVGQFHVLQGNHFKIRELVLQNHELYLLKPEQQVIDFQNVKLEIIDHHIGQGIRLTKNGQTFEFYGDVSKWFALLKKHCLQANFTQLYIIQKQIGKGNFGKVYKAQRKSDLKEFAVKVFEKKRLVNQVDRPALIKELDILRKLDHSGVLSLVEAFESDQFIFLVHELLRGGELYDNLKRIPPLSEEKAAKIINELLNSIEYIHNLGILHRDLKPENIILREKGQLEDLVIADFGLAEYYRKDGKYLFTRCGTPGYVAPEVLQDKVYDFKVDVYSIGILLYILIVGKSPFKGQTYDDVVYLNYKGEIDYSDLKLSPEIVDLFKLMLEPNPLKRGSIEQIRRHPWFRKWLRKSQTILVKRIVKLDRSTDQLTPVTPSTSNSLNQFIENSPKLADLKSSSRSRFFRPEKKSISRPKYLVSQLL